MCCGTIPVSIIACEDLRNRVSFLLHVFKVAGSILVCARLVK